MGKPKKKTTNDGGDDRFASINFNPKFVMPKKSKTKVKVDERFKHMFTDDDFGGATTAVDKYARKKKKKDRKGGADLKRFYKMSDDEEDTKKPTSDDDDEADDQEKPTNDDDSEKGEPTAAMDEDDRLEYLNRLARGEVAGSSSESEEEEDDDPLSSDDEGDATKHQDDEDDEEAEQEDIPVGDETSRFAVQNLDWSKVTAQDLYAVLNSFTPRTGKILKVTIHPSRFGEEMMTKEERSGPQVDFGGDFNDDADEQIAGEGAGYDPEKLRKYELDKLKYYFAVVECDSVSTASALYKECDGVEYEHTSNVLDLRFIPDEVEIDRPVRDSAKSVGMNYKPPEFVTKALQQSKVELTWDEDDYQRSSLQEWGKRDTKGGDVVGEQELEKFIASDNSDDEDSGSDGEQANNKNKYKQLLAGFMDGTGSGSEGASDEESDVEEPKALEASFIPGLTERIMEKKRKEKELANETPEERKLRIIREKKQKKREKKLAAAKASEVPEAIKKGFNDPFFSTGPSSKKDKKHGNKQDKRKRAGSRDGEDDGNNSEQGNEPTESTKAELELLMEDGKADAKLKEFDFKTIVEGEKMLGKKVKLRGKKKKRKLQAMEAAKNDSFQLDTTDDRFKALYSDPTFQIDRTNPQYVETRTMRDIERERAKRRMAREEQERTGTAQVAKVEDDSARLQSMVQSIKQKAAIATKKKKKHKTK